MNRLLMGDNNFISIIASTRNNSSHYPQVLCWKNNDRVFVANPEVYLSSSFQLGVKKTNDKHTQTNQCPFENSRPNGKNKYLINKNTLISHMIAIIQQCHIT